MWTDVLVFAMDLETWQEAALQDGLLEPSPVPDEDRSKAGA